jgi:hypothetical protein
MNENIWKSNFWKQQPTGNTEPTFKSFLSHYGTALLLFNFTQTFKNSFQIEQKYLPDAKTDMRVGYMKKWMRLCEKAIFE